MLYYKLNLFASSWCQLCHHMGKTETEAYALGDRGPCVLFLPGSGREACGLPKWPGTPGMHLWTGLPTGVSGAPSHIEVGVGDLANQLPKINKQKTWK